MLSRFSPASPGGADPATKTRIAITGYPVAVVTLAWAVTAVLRACVCPRDHTMRVHVMTIAKASGRMRDGGRRHTDRIEQHQTSDAGVIAADPGIVDDGGSCTGLKSCRRTPAMGCSNDCGTAVQGASLRDRVENVGPDHSSATRA
jgi:hypothetical protein